MEITREIFDKINELDEIFNTVETLSRVLTLYDNMDNITEYKDQVILIHLLFEKILVMKDYLDKFTSSLIQ